MEDPFETARQEMARLKDTDVFEGEPELYVNGERVHEHEFHAGAEECAEYVLRTLAGLDTKDPQERETPHRFCRALKEMTTPEPFEFTVFEAPENLDEMVIERGIPFYSLCRHHVLPFIGVAHIGYILQKKMPGLSKVARCVQFHSRGLRTQEELTVMIADDLVKHLDPLGVAVVMEAEHTCMTIRGVQAPGVKTYTGSMRGVFGDHTRTAKAEFLSRINNGR